MEAKVKKGILIAGLGFSLSASAALLYYLLKKEENNDGFIINKNKKSLSQQSTIILKIPKEAVGIIIGRQGSVIKELQEKTNTRIKFESCGSESRNDEKDQELQIRGTPENVQEAELYIHEMITKQPDITLEEIFIPLRACGRIIGRNGDNIRHMCFVSKAKINVDRSGNERDPDNMKRVTIRGTKAEIRIAVTLIDEKLAEEEAFRNEVISSSGRPNRYTNSRLAISFNGNTSSESNQDTLHRERLEISTTDGFSEVYISGVDDPSKFWVQLVGPKSVELDKLIEDMSNHYEIDHNRIPVGDTIKIGELVAAPFKPDSRWYRGLVEEILIDEYCPTDIKIRVYYVDFGDTELRELKEFCILIPQYNALPFQGIKCCLAHVQASNGTWSEEASNAFEKLTYAAQWKVIMAKPVTAVKSTENETQETFYVELVDTNLKRDINVAKELVNLNYAIWDTTQIGET